MNESGVKPDNVLVVVEFRCLPVVRDVLMRLEMTMDDSMLVVAIGLVRMQRRKP